MAFIITGQESEHGGAQCQPPVLVYDDGDTRVFAHPSVASPKEILTYATLTDAQLAASKIPRRMYGVEVDLSTDSKGIVTDVVTKLGGVKTVLVGATIVVDGVKIGL